MATFTITATGLSYTVKAGTFTNTVEVKDSLGWTYYYAPNVGPIKAIDNGKIVFELVELTDLK